MGGSIIGATLLNRFRVVDFIASGGMGAVYRVLDLERSVSLAMKVLHTELADDPSYFRRFQREANALKNLAHPNIVPFYGLYRTDEFAFLLEHFIDGPSLKDILRRRKGEALPIPEALTYLRALSAALGYAHAHGVVHCDVKPGNLMVDVGGNIYLTDFGIARHAESTVTTLGAAGTPAYMAPEQVRAEPVSPETDVYALGVMLFELLTGQRPFLGNEAGTEGAGTTVNERIRWAHQHLPPPDPRSLNPSMSEALAQVVLKALAKRPEERPNSARELFESACHAAGIPPEAVAERAASAQSARPPASDSRSDSLLAVHGTASLPEASRRPAKRSGSQPGVLIAIGGVVVILLAVLAFASMTPDSGSQPPASAGEPSQASSATEELASLSEPLSLDENEPDITVATNLPVETPEPGLPPQVSPETLITNVPDPTATDSPSPTLDLATAAAASGEPWGKIVFTCQIGRKEEQNQICMVAADGTGFQQLTNNAANHLFPSLSPDGNSLVYVSDESGAYEIYEMDLAGNSTQLTFGIGKLNAPEISPDGQWIVFTNKTAIGNEIWVMGRRGENPQPVYDVSQGFGWDPTWSPDGSQILFASGTVNRAYLSTMDAGGANARIVSDLSELSGRSDWSPDGAMIATYAGPTWGQEIYLIDLAGDTQPITEGGHNKAPSFSPDGAWVTYMSYRDHFRDGDGCEIYIQRLSNGEVRRLTDNDYCDWQPRWGP